MSSGGSGTKGSANKQYVSPYKSSLNSSGENDSSLASPPSPSKSKKQRTDNNNNKSNSSEQLQSSRRSISINDEDQNDNHHDDDMITDSVNNKSKPSRQHIDLVDFIPLKIDKQSILTKILDDENVRIGNYIYVPDPSQFKRALQKILYSSKQKQEQFIGELDKYLFSDEEMLKVSLSPVTTNEDRSKPKYLNDSFIRILISVPCIQTKVILSILEKATNYAGVVDDGLNFNYSKQIYSQLRWMENTNKDITANLLEQLDILQLNPTLRKDLISFLPEIIDDTGHVLVVDQLLRIMEDDSSLTVPILDTIGSLILTSTLRVKARDKMFQCLNSASLEEVPVILNSLLQSNTPKESSDTIRQLRKFLNFPPKYIYGSGGGTLTSFNEKKQREQKHAAESFVVESLKTNFRFKKELCVAFLKEMNSLGDSQFQVLDMWLLFIIYSFWNSPKDIESLFKKKIAAGVFTKSFLMSSIASHSVAMKDYFKSFISLCDCFLRTFDPKIRTFGVAFYVTLFNTFTDRYCQQDIIESLTTHIGSGNSYEIDEALEVLNSIARINVENLFPYTTYIKGILDHIDALAENQVRQLFQLFGQLAYKSTIVGDVTSITNVSTSTATKSTTARDGGGVMIHYTLKPNDLIFSDLEIFSRKQITNSTTKYKKIGIIALCSQVQRLATIPIAFEQKVNEKYQAEKEKLLEIPTELYESAIGIIETMLTNCRNSHVAMSYLYDEIVNVYNSAKSTFSMRIIHWVASRLENDLRCYLQDHMTHENEDIWYNDGDETMAVIIYSNLVEGGFNRDKLICLSSHFRLLQTFLRASSNGSLDSIENLLVISLEMFGQDVLDTFQSAKDKDTYALALFYAINWIRELLNGFSTQPSVHVKLAKRIEHLIDLENKFNFVLSHCIGFVIPYGVFNSDQRKKFSIDLSKVTKKKKEISNGEENIDEFYPYLRLIKPYFRQLDLNTSAILQMHYKMELNESASGSSSSSSSSHLLELDAKSLYYLLDDLYAKILVVATPEKFNPLNNSTTPKQHLTCSLVELISQLRGVFPALCIYLERIVSQLPSTTETINALQKEANSLREKMKRQTNKIKKKTDGDEDDENRDEDIDISDDNKDDDGGKDQDLEKKLHQIESKLNPMLLNQSYQTACMQLIFKSFEQIFTHSDLASESLTTFQELITSILEKKHSSFRQGQQISSQLTAIFNYFESFLAKFNRFILFKPYLSLVQLLISIYKNQAFPKKETNAEVTIQEFALNALAKVWNYKINSQAISFLLKTTVQFNSDPITIITKITANLLKFVADSADDKKSPKKKSKKGSEEEEEEEEVEDEVDSDGNKVNQVKKDKLESLHNQSALVYFKSIFSLMIERFEKTSFTPQDDMESTIETIVPFINLFKHMVAFIKYKRSHYLVETLRLGKDFVTSFTKHTIPILKALLKYSIKDTLDMVISPFQSCCRTLQHICTYGKKEKDISITKLIPQVMKSVETFLVEVKLTLTAMNCLGAFHTKELKKRNLDGKEINNNESSEEEAEEEDEDDENSSSDDDKKKKKKKKRAKKPTNKKGSKKSKDKKKKQKKDKKKKSKKHSSSEEEEEYNKSDDDDDEEEDKISRSESDSDEKEAPSESNIDDEEEEEEENYEDEDEDEPVVNKTRNRQQVSSKRPSKLSSDESEDEIEESSKSESEKEDDEDEAMEGEEEEDGEPDSEGAGDSIHSSESESENFEFNDDE